GCPDLFRSKVLATRRIDAGRVATPHTRMATGSRGTELSDLHMIVLGRIAQRAIADVDDIARWLGVPVVVAEILCADLKAAGLVTATATEELRRCTVDDALTRASIPRLPAFATVTALFPRLKEPRAPG